VRIETVSVGGSRLVHWNGRDVVTSIFKSPVAGPVMARRHNLDGDRQSDPTVHGGEFKAVYAYAAEHYAWWRETLGRDLEPPGFGENLTVSGFEEGSVNVGDVFRAGEAELEATEPRLPCFKLGIRLGDPRLVKTFADSGRWGSYFRVIKEGALAAGDALELVRADPERIPVSEIARVYLFGPDDAAAMRRFAAHERLDPSWRDYFRKKLGGEQSTVEG